MEQHRLIGARCFRGMQCYCRVTQNVIRNDIVAGDFSDANTCRWIRHASFSRGDLDLSDYLCRKILRCSPEPGSFKKNRNDAISQNRDPVMPGQKLTQRLDDCADYQVCSSPAFFCDYPRVIVQAHQHDSKARVDRLPGHLKLPVQIVDELGLAEH